MERPKKPQKVMMESNEDGTELFIVADGERIAKRGHKETPEAGTWISLKPGYAVTSAPDHSCIEIFLNNERIH